MAQGEILFEFYPDGAELPASNYPNRSLRNNHPVLQFDAATDQSCYWTKYLDGRYSGRGITVRLIWAGATATSNNVVWNVGFERLAENDLDIDGDSFASVQAATDATQSTSGKLQYTDIAFTNSQIDGLLANELFRLVLTRDADNGSDNMSGLADVLAVIGIES